MMMIRIPRICVFLIILFCSAAAVWGQADPTWTDPVATIIWDGGGNDGNWDNPDNWDTNSVPQAADDVFIPGGYLGNYPTTTPNGIDIRSVIIDAGASLRLTEDASISYYFATNLNGTLDLNGCDITGNSPFDNDGTLRARGGENIGTGNSGRYLSGPGTDNPYGDIGFNTVFYGAGNDLIIGRTSYFNLTIEDGAREASGVTQIRSNLTIEGGSLEFTSDIDVTNAVTLAADTDLIVGGDFTAASITANIGSTVTLTGDAVITNAVSLNNGADLTVGGNFSAASINAAANSTVTLTGDAVITNAVTLAAGTGLIAGGDFSAGSITAPANSTVTLTGAGTFAPLDDDFGNLTIDRALNISNQTVTAAGTITLTNNANVNANNAAISANSFQTAGTISANAATISATDFSQTAGTISSTGALTMTISGTAGQSGGGSISATGMLIMNGGGSYTLTEANTVGSISGIRPAGTGGAISFTDNTGFTVQGITTNGTNVTLTSNGTVSQSGAINIGQGTLTLQGTGTYTLTDENNAVGTISTGTRTTLTGGGAINFRDDGGFTVAGIVTTSDTNLTLRSNGPVIQTGAIDIAIGTLTLNGTGDYTLDNAGNKAGALTIGGRGTGGTIIFRDDTGFAVSAITATDADITLIAHTENAPVAVPPRSIRIDNPITTGTGGSVTLTAPVEVTGGTITTGTLILNKPDVAYTLTNANSVVVITTGGVSTGEIQFTNSIALGVGVGANGIKTNGANVTLTNTGAVTQNAAIEIGTGNLILNGNGSYTLDNAANTVGSISTGNRTGGGLVSFTNSSNLIVGYNGNGIRTANANVTLTANVFSFAAGGSINAGSAEITLNTNNNSFNSSGTAAVNLTASTVTINAGTGSVSIPAGSNFSGITNTLAIRGGNVSIDNTVAMNMANLAISSTGTADLSLTLGNNVSRIAVRHGGNITLTKASGNLAIADFSGLIPGLIGITTSTTSGIVTLNTAGAVTQEANAIVTAYSLVLSGAGSYVLTQANAVGAISTGTRIGGGLVSFTNSTGFTANRIITNNALVTLNINPNNNAYNILLNDDITTGSGAVTFSDNVRLGNNITITSSGGVTFSGTVNGNQNLTIANGTGTVSFLGNVGAGGVGNVIGSGTGTDPSLSIAVSGTTTFNGTLTTNSGIEIAGPVVFNSDVTIGAGNASSTLNGLVTINPNVINIRAGQNITFANNVILETAAAKAVIQTTANNGNITFGGTINSNRSLEMITNGTGEVIFSENVTVSGSSNPALKITAYSLDVQKIINTSGGVNKNIELIVDGLLLTNDGSGSINAGTGNVTLYPQTPKSIEYGDTNTALNTAVYYSSKWTGFIADSFTVGVSTYSEVIYMTGVASASSNLTLQNGSTIYIEGDYVSTANSLLLNSPNTMITTASRSIKARGITFGVGPGTGNITANGAGMNLTLTAEIGDINVKGVVGSGNALGDITIASAKDVSFGSTVNAAGIVSINKSGLLTVNGNITAAAGFTQTGGGTNNIGASIFTTALLSSISFANNVVLTLNGLVTFSTSTGGGNIQLSGTVTPDAATGRNLTLNAGTGDIAVNATVGADTNRLGALTINSAANATFSNAVFVAGFSFTGANLTVNNALTVTGQTTINISGLFTKNSTGSITANGGFTQNGTGTNSIGADISTTNTDIFFTNPIDISGSNAIIFSTGAGDGNITLNSNVTRDTNQKAITLNAGTGTVTTADIGEVTPAGFADITINGNDVTLNGNLYSENTVDINGTGAVSIESTGGIIAQGIITADGTTITNAGNIEGQSSITLTATTAINTSGTISAQALFTANGPVTNNGTIQAGPVADGANAIVFNESYNVSGGTGLIIGSPSSNPFTVFNKDVSFNGNTITLDGDIIKFAGTGDQNFNPGTNVITGDIIIESTSNVKLTGNSATQNGTLTIVKGLDLSGTLGWHMNDTYQASASFSGTKGTLTFGDTTNQNVSLITPSFSTSNDFSIVTAGTGTKTVFLSGNVTIAHTADDDTENIDFEITVNASVAVDVDTNDKQIGNLVINNGDITLRSALSIKHDIIIKIGTLDVSASNCKITVGRHWRQYLKANEADPDPFNPRNGTVEFTAETGVDTTGAWTGTRKAIIIQGSTTWWNFKCNTAQPIIIKFARNNHNIDNNITHKFLNNALGGFTVKTTVSGTAPNDRTILTRMDDADYDTSIFAAPPGGNGVPPFTALELNRYYFWNIHAKTASLDFDNVTVNYSWADPDSIQLLHVRFDDVDAIPHLGNLSGDIYEQQNHYCVGWTEGIEFVYSYTEDANHNGRIDRIRVQASTVFNGTFDDSFKVEVDGYKVLGLPGRVPSRDDMFYIYLEEMPYADTGNTLTWRLLNNDAITEAETGLDYEFMTFRREDMKTIDTTWPVVSYSLMLPKNSGDTSTSQQLFIQFSEPVMEPIINLPFVPQSITALSPFTALSIFTANNNTYAKEYIVEFALTNEITVQDMINELRYTISNHNDVLDYKGALDPTDQSNPDNPGPDYPYPLFPDNSNYSSYTTQPYYPMPLLDTYDAITPGYDFRITDVLISIPPANSADKRYFAWPFLGRDEIAFLEGAGAFSDTTEDLNLVAIRKFDGSGTLRDSEITLDVNTHADFQSPSLIIGVSVPDSFKASTMNGVEGLWLPYDSGLVPWRLQPIMQYVPDSVSSNNLSTYKINKNENDFADEDVIDFYFQDFPGLSAGRLDMAPGARIPADWYRKIKPFSFKINEMTYQRGGATILNNVINPTRGEKTYLNSKLTKSGQVTIQVFTLDGTLVQVLHRGSRSAGEYIDSWDGKNRGGRVVARGMYFIRIVGPDIDEIRKVMVIR